MITLILAGEESNLWIPYHVKLPPPPATSPVLDINILLSNLFSNTVSPNSSLRAKDQVPHPRNTIGGVIIAYFNV
jgi:hypothetical protein